MVQIIINPDNTDRPGSKRQADRAMHHFVREVAADLQIQPDDIRQERVGYRRNHRNRYTYRLHLGARSVLVQMPGLPLKQVRYRKGDNAWDFTRLAIGEEGSTWLWPFAVSSVTRHLTQDWDAELGDWV